jgi:hypothetical protein
MRANAAALHEPQRQRALAADDHRDVFTIANPPHSTRRRRRRARAGGRAGDPARPPAARALRHRGQLDRERRRPLLFNVFYNLVFRTDPVVATVSPMLAHNYFASLGINVELDD